MLFLTCYDPRYNLYLLCASGVLYYHWSRETENKVFKFSFIKYE